MSKFRVYFSGIPSHTEEDVIAKTHVEAMAIIASRYGLASDISAVWHGHSWPVALGY